MSLKKMSNAELVYRFETACFRFTNYPNNKSIGEEFARVERELCKRLGCTTDEVQMIEEGKTKRG